MCKGVVLYFQILEKKGGSEYVDEHLCYGFWLYQRKTCSFGDCTVGLYRCGYFAAQASAWAVFLFILR